MTSLRRSRPARTGLASLALALAVAAAGCAGGRTPQVHRVSIHGFGFDPATTTAAPGDTVVFTNADVAVHTATSPAGGWDSGPIPVGGTWKLVVEEGSAGAYHCTFHPTMTAALAAAN